MHKWACARICVKYFNDNLPEGNMDCLEEKRTTYSTRSLDDGRVLNIPSALSKQMEQMCATTIPTIWNKEVPSGIKHFQEATFLSAYKDHFLQQYKAFTCTKSNCYSCKQWAISSAASYSNLQIPFKLTVYLIQLLNDMPSRISCFSLSTCPLSLNLCLPPLNAARPTPTTPRQVWWMKLWWY